MPCRSIGSGPSGRSPARTTREPILLLAVCSSSAVIPSSARRRGSFHESHIRPCPLRIAGDGGIIGPRSPRIRRSSSPRPRRVPDRPAPSRAGCRCRRRWRGPAYRLRIGAASRPRGRRHQDHVLLRHGLLRQHLHRTRDQWRGGYCRARPARRSSPHMPPRPAR